jgi:hypothetical protein
MMKRRVCSYDMFAVPDPSFVLKDGQLPSAEPIASLLAAIN